jgi:hypothetical protein
MLLSSPLYCKPKLQVTCQLSWNFREVYRSAPTWIESRRPRINAIEKQLVAYPRDLTLRIVAATTGGLYAHAADREQLEAIYQRLDQLETRKAQTITHRPRRDVYWWPLALGLVVSLLMQMVQLGVERFGPRSQPRRPSPNQEQVGVRLSRAAETP